MEKEFAIDVPYDKLAELARKWRVEELSLFGSVVNGDFREDSDVDVLVAFEKDAPWSAWDFVHMMDELAELFGRKVDLVERDAVENPYVRRSIFSTRKIVYAA
jgi:predicted nucleotidyltransferase